MLTITGGIEDHFELHGDYKNSFQEEDEDSGSPPRDTYTNY